MNLWNNQNNSALSTLDKFNLVEIILGLGLFLSPFFFLPFTADYIELNKAYLFMLVGVLSFVAFAFQGFKKGSLYIKSIHYYYPFLILLIAGFLSVYFSQNIKNSLFGTSGVYLNSFLILISLTLTAFVAVNVRLNVRSLINYFLAGLAISTFVALMGFYTPMLPYLAKFLPTTILAESYSSLLAMLVFGVSVSAYFLFMDKKENAGPNGLYYVSLILGLIYLFVIPNLFALIALAAVTGYFVLTQRDFDFNKQIVSITAVAVLIGVVSVLHYIPPIKQGIGFNPISDYPRLDIVSSWYVAATNMRDNPFWGSGLNNYLTTFTEFRPAYLNNGPFWNIRYNYPFNDVFTWLTTAGLVGFAAYILFLYFVLSKSFNKRDLEARDPVLSVSVFVIFTSLLLLGSSLPLTFLFFILAAVLFQNNRGSVFALKTGGSLLTILIVSLGLFGFLMYQAYGVYASQVYLNKSFRSGNLLERYELQRVALKNNTIDPALYREAILTNLAIATRLSSEKNLTDDQKKDVENLLRQAINDSVVVTEVLDSYNASNWEVRGILNKSLIGLDGEDKRFSTIAAQSYMNAIQRDPTNPLLRIELGNIYYQNKDYVNAANYFVQAIQLKSDYANSYYNLAYALKDAGDYANALTQITVVERLIPTGTPESEKIKKEIEEFTKLAEANKDKGQQAVSLPEGVKTPDVKATDTATDQTIVGPEENASYQLQTSEDLNVQPVDVKQDENVNLEESNLDNTGE